MHFAVPDIRIFNIILTVVGAVGVTGAIALAVLAPAVAEPIFAAVLRVVGKILGTRIGLAFVVGFSCLVVGELAGTHQANQTCRATIAAKEKQADAAAAQRDQEQGRLTADDVQGHVAELEAINTANEVKLHDYEQQLAAHKGASCALSPDDVQRMRF